MLRELPEGWEWTTLEEICTKITDGTHVTPNYLECGIPFLSVRNLTKGFVDFKDVKYISKEEHQQITKRCKPTKGDILYTKVGTYGIADVVDTDEEFSIFVSLALLKPIFDKIDPYFLKVVLNSNFVKRQADRRIKGIGVPDLHLVEIKKFRIPLPPLSVQRKIVDVLEQAEAVKRQRLEADALTGALLQSVFYEMFGDSVRNERGWEVIEFGDIICETKNGLYKTEKFQGKGTPILRMYNIYKNQIVLNKFHLITITDDEFEQYQVKPGDILFNRVNSPIWLGKSAVIPKDIGKFVFESKNIRIRVDTSKADPEYIVWYLSTPAGREEISKRAKAAVNQSTVNNTDLREFRILLPPLTLQQQFARVVEDVERIRERQVASGKAIEGLCEGLMARAFSGELSIENV